MYRKHAIINRGLYILNPLVEGQKQFLKEVFQEISAYMYGLYSRAVSNQERVMMACVQYCNTTYIVRFLKVSNSVGKGPL